MARVLPIAGDRDGCHAGGVGFNPYHPKKRTPSDYLLVAAAVVVCLALVAWAFLG
jgi:hypothetical protein